MNAYVELDSAPWYGYERVEKFGEPWDTFIAAMDVDGTPCSHCGGSCGGDIYDLFSDEGHRMAWRWRYVALIAVDGVVQPLCEDCALTALPPFLGPAL